jgi:SAM-dependent methyltransferase
MSNYRAKTGYQKMEAIDYETARFVSPQGKLTDAIEQTSVRRLIRGRIAGGYVLDLAGGTGRFSKLLLDSEPSCRVVTADISIPLLRATALRCRDQRYTGAVRCDAEVLPFSDNAFEAVVSIRFLGLLPKEVFQIVLSETARVSRKWVIAHVPNSFSYAGILRMLLKHTGRESQSCFLFPWNMRSVAAKAGLTIVETRRPFLLPTRYLPVWFLPCARIVNWLGARTSLGYFSGDYFLLMRKG